MIKYTLPVFDKEKNNKKNVFKMLSLIDILKLTFYII